MQKQAPSLTRILIAAGFALSCFGLLLFLWVTFGGPIPFKPESYRFTADFPEATQLATETDVRIGGVSVGKVKKTSVPKDENVTRAEIELYPEYAPLPSDARATLRQKTLLGENYVELTRGSPAAAKLKEGGHLADTQIQDQTQIDEIFNALDPQTRQNFRLWQLNAQIAGEGRGLDLNDALGNLGPFAADAAEVLQALERQDKALGDLIRHTGGVFEALSSRGEELAGAITGSNATFGALAAQERALAETIRIFPTFNRETRLTLNKLDEFAHNTNPLIVDLKPVARDLSPTLKSVRQLSPSLKSLFQNLDPLITAGNTGLPALESTLTALRPVLRDLDPFLANLAPIVRYLHYYENTATDFLSNPEAALAGSMDSATTPGQPAPRHYLRQISYLSAESLSVWPQRLPTNRGNGYLPPDITQSGAAGGIFPNFDCKPSGGPVSAAAATEANAACFVASDFPAQFGGGRAPQIFADP
jgi:virulence factor Mce-like protein